MKYCAACKLNKDETNFHKNRSRKDGLQHHCKQCSRTKWGRTLTCGTCGVGFYVYHRNVKSRKTTLCVPCAFDCGKNKRLEIAKKNATYVFYNQKGYKFIFIGGEKKYKLEHRLIMENKLGRKLNKHEVVHHIDNNIKNNAIENLWLTDHANHRRSHLSLSKAAWEAVRHGSIVFNHETGTYELAT